MNAGGVGRRALWALGGASLLAMIAFGVSMAGRWTSASRPQAPPVLAALPGFSLTERRGDTVSLADLAGGPWVADFIFTRCALSCPRMTAQMRRLGDLLPSTVRRVSFTVDPDHDTAEVLTGYAESQGATGPDWLFLTGEREAVEGLVVEGFHLGLDSSPAADAASPEEPILHSTRFVLVDSGGRIRGYYDASLGSELERLARDARSLIGEPSASARAPGEAAAS